MNDWLALLISFVYVFVVLALGEGIRRWRGYSSAFTRKIIHIGVGMWIFGTVALFKSMIIALIPPLAFVVINFLSYRYGWFLAMEAEEKGNLGTVYFPIAFAALIALFWGHPALLTASLMPMTWGDAMGAVIGKRMGQHRLGLHGRTVEGSAAVFAFGFAAVALTLGAVWGVQWPQALGIGAASAAAATVIEAVTPWGLDNFTVPAVSALALYAFLG